MLLLPLFTPGVIVDTLADLLQLLTQLLSLLPLLLLKIVVGGGGVAPTDFFVL